MIKLASAEHLFALQPLKDLLDEHSIPCCIRNQYLSSVAGEVPPHETWPELWLLDAEWLPKAQQLSQQLKQEASSHTGWHCPQCDEFNEPEFNVCWQCQGSRAV